MTSPAWPPVKLILGLEPPPDASRRSHLRSEEGDTREDARTDQRRAAGHLPPRSPRPPPFSRGDELVVAAGAEQVGSEAVPRHVLDDVRVAGHAHARGPLGATTRSRAAAARRRLCRTRLDVEDAYELVVTGGREAARCVRRPREAVALFLVALAAHERADGRVGGPRRVLGPVEDEDVGRRRLGCHDKVVLRGPRGAACERSSLSDTRARRPYLGAVAGPVHLAVVVDAHSNLDLCLASTVAAQLCHAEQVRQPDTSYKTARRHTYRRVPRHTWSRQARCPPSGGGRLQCTDGLAPHQTCASR